MRLPSHTGVIASHSKDLYYPSSAISMSFTGFVFTLLGRPDPQICGPQSGQADDKADSDLTLDQVATDLTPGSSIYVRLLFWVAAAKLGMTTAFAFS